MEAGAGTGKTYTLINKIKVLLNSLNTNPQKIVCITFTSKAAAELKERLNNDKVIVKTFHKYILDLIKPSLNKTLCPAEIPFSKEELLKITNYKNKHTRVQPLCYAYYQNYLKINNYFDFDDIFLFYLQSNLVKPSIKYLFIDEFQDTNNLQYLIIKKIISPTTRIIAVGDSNQAIYQFRGANQHIITRFQKEFQAKKYYLNENYRSFPQLITYFNHFNNKNKLVPTIKGQGLVKYLRFKDINEEQVRLYHLLLRLRKTISFTDILITARNHHRLYYIKNYLQAKLLNYESLNIMSIHATKGLEFKVVILIGLEQGEFPSLRENTLTSLRGEKRLFYVAITRAKQYLFLCNTKIVNNNYYLPSFNTKNHHLP